MTEEKIYPNGDELTFCSLNWDGKKGCRKMTKSVKSSDGTHYYCEECQTTK
jgi:hypothetical protein